MRNAIKIGVIGRSTDQLCDGQTIKTRVLCSELKRKYPKAELFLADTYQYKKHPLRLLKNIFRCMRKSQVVFILLSRNGMRVIFPIVNILNKIYKKPILHDCIGGSLDEIVKIHPGVKKQLNRFNVNWVESVRLKERLEKKNIRNVEYLPNFKRLCPVTESDLKMLECTSYHFCTFSRVNEDKGIGRAIEAITKINKEAGNQKVMLDIYGPIEGDYGEVLDDYIVKANGAVKYMGIADSNKSVDILKNYYALLFPTTFQGEGFPGTLIDALCAGLPVIATDWHCNSEIITNGYTGYVYPVNEPEQLQNLISFATENIDTFRKMRYNCLKEAEKYNADQVIDVICKKIDQVLS